MKKAIRIEVTMTENTRPSRSPQLVFIVAVVMSVIG